MSSEPPGMSSELGGLRIAGEPASSMLADPDFTGTIIAHFATCAGPGRALACDDTSGEVTRLTAGCLELARNALDRRRTPTEADLAPVAEAAARWAEAGVALEAVLQLLHESVRMAWRRIAGEAGAPDTEHVRAAAELFGSVLGKITVAAAGAYEGVLALVVETPPASAPERRPQPSPPSTETPAFGGDTSLSFVVLAVHVSTEPDGQRRSTAHDRRLRAQIRAELTRACGPTTLSVLTPDGGTVLLPGTPARDRVDELVDRLSRAADLPVYAAAVPAAALDLAEASHQAHELLDLALRLRLPPGVHRIDELVFEYQVTRPGWGREGLADLLAPLARAPELLLTLETHIDTDLSRKQTALRLDVHPNTVDYRLRRIADLTGLDPSRQDGLRVLETALLSTRL
ncbi:PucR family transcriptional regulator [Rhodococcus triatomae]|uniref:PucR C-terminal helix-turn-helix domain-containing protein n=1 Tax=Rhodococcus triatomae TaxID=300028 RepID=A0A1G8SG22_9NOCA|nr:helix-turn-helix domain-containing protein [Rhodococcus triatomae]QNG20701.1 PucR family transcriptional regulator [Rhodococcus triatomae]QNG23381.1 PucR family transcriptional regulator [Rhodococcus triatomae]SDJ28158.1 PucR C-terminal helix-turn-helix domain-containing protein [Rhodococcus triatomae]